MLLHNQFPVFVGEKVAGARNAVFRKDLLHGVLQHGFLTAAGDTQRDFVAVSGCRGVDTAAPGAQIHFKPFQIVFDLGGQSLIAHIGKRGGNAVARNMAVALAYHPFAQRAGRISHREVIGAAVGEGDASLQGLRR